MKYISLILLCVIAWSCTPVRTSIYNKKPEKSEAVSNESNISGNIQIEKPRFSDTTYILLDSPIKLGKQTIADHYQNCVKNFEEGDYAAACDKFRRLWETIKPGDTLYYETMFHISECEIQNQRLVKAEKILYELLHINGVPVAIHEKTMVRLGHVYCAMELFDEAEKQFSTFLEQYPDSRYSPLADCGILDNPPKPH